MKYVTFKKVTGRTYIVMFSEAMSHQEVCARLSVGHYDTAVSAGFVRESADGLYCMGESVSLKMKSREDEDTNLLRASLAAS